MKIIVFIILAINPLGLLVAQDTLVMPLNGNGGVYNTCYAIIFDQGLDFNYANNIHSTITIAPLWVEQVNLFFEVFETEYYFDSLTIYDGPGSAFPRIGSYSGNALQGQTISSSTGAITLEFITDDVQTYQGFKIEVSCLVGIEVEEQLTPTIFPNPVFNFFSVKGVKPEEIKWVYISDLSGRHIHTISPSIQMDIKDLNTGIYHLKIECSNGKNYFMKLVKQ